MSDSKIVRALKRELAGRGKRDPLAADEILRELALHGEKVEKREKPKAAKPKAGGDE